VTDPAGHRLADGRPRVDVIILNYNGLALIEPCLRAVDAQGYGDFGVTVVDNGSTDGSVAWLREHRLDVRLVVRCANDGFAAAYDEQIRTSTAELVALLNNDAEPDPGWLSALVDALDGDPGVAAATSRIRFAADERTLNHAGGSLSPLGSGFDDGFGAADGPTFDTPRDCGVPSGAACLVRQADFVAAGGFDRRYFAWFEDVDLGWRLWLRGRRVRYVPTATVKHRYGGTGGGRAAGRRIYHCQKNRLANATKHLSPAGLVLALACGVVYDIMRVLGAFGRGEGLVTGWAITRGTLAYVRWLPALVAERRCIQRSRRLSDAALRREGALAAWRTALAAYRLASGYHGTKA
jgi:GT2 family glycosyltransferase